jgi:hypothetical protein
MRVQKGSDLGSDHFLTLAKLRFPPNCLHLPKNTAHKENVLQCTIILLVMKVYDGCTNKEFKRNYNKLQKAATLCWNGRHLKRLLDEAQTGLLRPNW